MTPSARTSDHSLRAQPHDLTQKLLQNLDRHLGLPLLNFLEERGLYPAEQLLQAKFELLRPTNMVTYIAELDKELHPDRKDDPKLAEGASSVLCCRANLDLCTEYRNREQAILKQLQDLEQRALKVMDIITGPEVLAALKQDKEQNLAYLQDNHKVRSSPLFCMTRWPTDSTALPRRDHGPLPHGSLSVLDRSIRLCFRLPLPFPRPHDRRRAGVVGDVGQAGLGRPRGRMGSSTWRTRAAAQAYR